MQVVRTIIWVLILVGVVLFSFFNWRDVEVMIWDNLVLETKVPALVIISFLLGFLPSAVMPVRCGRTLGPWLSYECHGGYSMRPKRKLSA